MVALYFVSMVKLSPRNVVIGLPLQRYITVTTNVLFESFFTEQQLEFTGLLSGYSSMGFSTKIMKKDFLSLKFRLTKFMQPDTLHEIYKR